MIIQRDLFYQTPDGEHFFRQEDGFVTIVAYREECPAIQRLRYWPGMLYAYGCVPTSAAAYAHAFNQTEALLRNMAPKVADEIPFTPGKIAS
ncbi:hypothetical protein BWI93_02780 [Siphonobacter sp. BAB-5385]|uniref:Uncharacterized protein n=1 Tax=Siphonobacter curvatus TaxID=2094562 RepID=A0A2S7IMI1_9BACT|nr:MULTISPECIES: hypothetical protein [Siphonobacter]OZI09619.1 hypothetical protein BWI93_02780 [Siphonobacter sp. BAB-5385]PMD98276.1 hypothetical protein BWI97_06225 [Siphonobacter sp. BAB-5405]PQA58934.1 hypothetical protein C5O19_04550 [Siphonobacter curvatus]